MTSVRTPILIVFVLWAVASSPPCALAAEPSPPQPAAAPRRPLTIDEALARAVAANPALASARVEVTAAQGQVRALLATVLPKIGLSGSLIENSESASFGSGSDSRTVLPAQDWNYRLTLAQPIFAGNRERRALEQSRLAVDVARAGERQSRDRLLLGVLANYLGVVRADALLDVERRNVALAQERRGQAQAFFDAGETTRVDVLRAEADVKAAERRLADVGRVRAEAESRLRVALAFDEPLAPIEPDRLYPERPEESVLVAQAEANRPEVARAATAVEIARLEVRKQKGALLPVLTADGAWVKQRSSFPVDQYGFLALRLTVPIYQGGEVKAKVAVANERLHQAELALDDTRRGVREEVRRALAAVAAADAGFALANEQLAAAEAEFAQADELYRAQELTALDARAAETSLADARRAVVASRLDRDLAELEVWAAAGLLGPNVGQTPDQPQAKEDAR